MTAQNFRSVFYPRSIAVIGASSDPTKFGGMAYMSLKGRRLSGRLYAVNPNLADVEGSRTYPRVRDIEEDVDFAVVTVPARFVVDSLADCAAKGVRAVEILTAGFTETGSVEGMGWEKEMTAIARKSGMRIIGPNCFGVYSPKGGLTMLPGPDFPEEEGPVGLMAQSGGFASALLRNAMELGVRFSKAVSYGNACDVNETDLLTYFREDGGTKVVAAYLEGVKDGRGFYRTVRKTCPEKPVIVWKGGLSNQGARAVASHTASLAGAGEVWEGFFAQTGAVRAESGSEMLDLIVGFVHLSGFSGRRVCVVGGGGAITVAAADALERAGLSIQEFSEPTKQAIRACLPPHGNSVKNPVDMGTPVYAPQSLTPILEAVVQSDRVDAVIVEQWILPFAPGFDPQLAEVIPRVRKAGGKPFVVTLPLTSNAPTTLHIEETRRKYRAHYLAEGIPVFDTLERAAGVLGKVVAYGQFAARHRA